MTAKKLLDSLSQLGEVKTVFSFPFVKVFVVSERFRELDDEDRELLVAKELQVSLREIRLTAHNALLAYQFVSPEEFADGNGSKTSRGHHWLSALIAPEPTSRAKGVPPVIHFYGYKGGQARSTALAMLASSVARDGWKVLVVDSDVEAPSLDVIFGATTTSLSRTLLGITQGSGPTGAMNVSPSRATRRQSI
jgi:Mrp family chromosome partitioning ATPase